MRASTYVWVSGSDFVAWRQQNSNRIDLITDNDSYQVGDEAEILIASPWQGTATALITIERGDVLMQDVITLETNSTTYRFPIEDDFAPNVFVTVTLVKGVDDTTPVAEFRVGMTQITVDPARREINVTVTPDREQAGPRETVTYTVETTDYAGDPVSAEVGVGLTDLAVLSLADPNSQPLMRFFYGQQGLSVRTAIPLVVSVDQLTQTTLDTIKGGGGGGGEGGIFEVRQEFVDTPYWNPTIVTDANGQATFDVTLPDNLTTWELDARAVTSGASGTTLVGQTTTDLLSTKPLLVRPVTPRFFVVGDALTLAAVVNNNTGETMSVDASLQAAGLTFNSPQDITAEIEAGQRQRFEWMVTVEDADNVDLTFYANGNDGAYTDASKPPLGQGDDRLLPVYRYEVPETVGTGGMIDDAGTRTEAIALPRRFDVTQGELTVQVDPSLAATTLDGLDYLENFPYQCTEQTVSRFLPNIITYRALDDLDVADADPARQPGARGVLRPPAALRPPEVGRRLGLVRQRRQQPVDHGLRPDRAGRGPHERLRRLRRRDPARDGVPQRSARRGGREHGDVAAQPPGVRAVRPGPRGPGQRGPHHAPVRVPPAVGYLRPGHAGRGAQPHGAGHERRDRPRC